jgi:hypothetical protein
MLSRTVPEKGMAPEGRHPSVVGDNLITRTSTSCDRAPVVVVAADEVDHRSLAGTGLAEKAMVSRLTCRLMSCRTGRPSTHWNVTCRSRRVPGLDRRGRAVHHVGFCVQHLHDAEATGHRTLDLCVLQDEVATGSKRDVEDERDHDACGDGALRDSPPTTSTSAESATTPSTIGRTAREAAALMLA